MKKPTVSKVTTANVFDFLANRLIAGIESAPITVEYILSGGSVTEEITEKHPWYKELSRRKAEQVKSLRASWEATEAAQ